MGSLWGHGAAKSKKVTTVPSETQNTSRTEYTQGASFRSVLGGGGEAFIRKVPFRLIQNNASHRGREAFFVKHVQISKNEVAQEEITAKKEQTAGVMHKFSVAMHRNIFAVGLLGGKSAQVTSENAGS